MEWLEHHPGLDYPWNRFRGMKMYGTLLNSCHSLFLATRLLVSTNIAAPCFWHIEIVSLLPSAIGALHERIPVLLSLHPRAIVVQTCSNMFKLFSANCFQESESQKQPLPQRIAIGFRFLIMSTYVMRLILSHLILAKPWMGSLIFDVFFMFSRQGYILTGPTKTAHV